MSKINIKKSTTAATITASILLGLMLLSPTTMLPQINAQQSTIPSLPSHVVKTLDSIHQQLKNHSGWISMMKWDSSGTTIDYLGPADKNPYLVKSGPNTSLSAPSVIPLSASIPINLEDPPLADRSGSTSEYKEVQDFTVQKSSVSTVNFYQILNALNSDKSHWMQNVLVYDNYGAYGGGARWVQLLDVFNKATCSDSPGISASTSLNISAGDAIEQYTYAQSGSPGQYDFGETDITKNNGYVTSTTISGDTGSSINLDKTNCGVNGYDSGPEVEEHAQNGVGVYHFNQIAFTEGYYDTSSSSKTTSVTGWDTTDGCGATVSNQNNPAKATFTYSGAC